MNFSCKASLIIALLMGMQMPVVSEIVGLEQVIKEVSTKSDSAKMMQETVIKSKQTIREQWANALPTVSTQIFSGRAYTVGADIDMTKFGDLSANATKYDVLSIFGSQYESGKTAVYNSSVQISQPIYTFGKVGTAVKVANFYDSSNQLTYKRNIQTLQLLGLDAFYQVVLTDMSLRIIERSSERKKELSEFLTRNFKLGSGSKAQILSVSADLEMLWPDIIKARQNAKTARQRLCLLMGRAISDSIDVDTASVLQSLATMELPSLDSAIKVALEKRNDLHSLDYLKKANEGGIKIYRAMYLPSIAGQVSFGFGGTDPEDLVDWDKRTWQVGVGLSWTMFDGFANSAKAQQYLSDSRKLEYGRDAVTKAIEIEVEETLTECVAADSNLVASYKVLAAAQESYNLTNENFKQGSGEFAELQLAELTLRQGEMGVMNARYRQTRSRAALLVTMGRPIISMEGK